MRSRTILLWIELLFAGSLLAAAAVVGPAGAGKACKTTPCTYFTKSNAELRGKCGTLAGKNGCYCIVKANPKKHIPEKHQLQSGCEVPGTE